MAKLGDYEVLRALKTGGMGEVLLARRRGPEGFEKLVAVKTIRAELAGAAAVRAMFLDEAKLLARLAHPAIAQVSDFGEEQGGLYLVMEYVPGLRFRELAERGVPPAIAARAVAEAARGVHAAHELRDLDGHAMGVVHRDLSPENLILGWDGQVKVLDFGIALVKGRQAPVTEVGTVKGKPPYMSPEQVTNDAVDRRSDVWSLGLVLHELITGEAVFEGESIYAVARSVIEQEIRAPSEVAGAAMPAGLDAAVMGALARDVGARTPTAAAFAEQLERVAAAEGGETLASWATRELADEREANRKWLAEVVARATGQRAAMGRPTGVVTAVGVPLPELASETAPDTVPDAEPEPSPPSRRWMWIAIALLLVGALIGVVMIASSGKGKATLAAAPIDAGTAVAVVHVDAGERDASASDAARIVAEAPAPVDAGELVDARAHAVVAPRKPDAREAAAVVVAPPDAAPAVAPVPSGAGTITFTADPYATILVDGHDWSSTPRFNVKIPAGRHHVQLVSPDTGNVRIDRTVDVRDGDHVDVHP
jgi:predicted Ser/Thr protein kinase